MPLQHRPAPRTPITRSLRISQHARLQAPEPLGRPEDVGELEGWELCGGEEADSGYIVGFEARRGDVRRGLVRGTPLLISRTRRYAR